MRKRNKLTKTRRAILHRILDLVLDLNELGVERSINICGDVKSISVSDNEDFFQYAFYDGTGIYGNYVGLRKHLCMIEKNLHDKLEEVKP